MDPNIKKLNLTQPTNVLSSIDAINGRHVGPRDEWEDYKGTLLEASIRDDNGKWRVTLKWGLSRRQLCLPCYPLNFQHSHIHHTLSVHFKISSNTTRQQCYLFIYLPIYFIILILIIIIILCGILIIYIYILIWWYIF